MKIEGISRVMTEKNIIFFPTGVSKEQVFRSLIDTFQLPDPNVALKAILDRELWGSTVIVPGLALPHARIPGIKQIAAAIGICSGPVPHIFVLFIGPVDNMKMHLDFLSSVSAIFQKESLLNAIAQLKTPELVVSKIREVEKTVS
jgi:mannitol/fructose-specific phosphotransferase system IIA component (Ntr-type)